MPVVNGLYSTWSDGKLRNGHSGTEKALGSKVYKERAFLFLNYALIA